jgi:hypothetical protein
MDFGVLNLTRNNNKKMKILCLFTTLLMPKHASAKKLQERTGDMFIQKKKRDLVSKNGIARAATDCHRRSTSCAVRLRASCGVRP